MPSIDTKFAEYGGVPGGVNSQALCQLSYTPFQNPTGLHEGADPEPRADSL